MSLNRENKYKSLFGSLSYASIQSMPQHWADLGCGRGVFTRTLAEILPSASRITSVDKAMQRLDHSMGDNVEVSFVQSDFEKNALRLPKLDGILMANSLHFIFDKMSLVRKLEKCFRKGKKILIVEYDTDTKNDWVPYPLSFERCKILFEKLGYASIKKLNSVSSVYGGSIYAASIAEDNEN